MCLIFRKIFNFISCQFKPTKLSWNWGNDWIWIAKEKERVEINDDNFGEDPASLQSTFVRISIGGPSGRWIEPCPRGGGGGPDCRELDVTRCSRAGHHLSALMGGAEREPWVR